MSSLRWAHRQGKRREYDAKRAQHSSARRWYASAAWKQKAKDHRALHPWCEACRQMGKTRRGRIVDHVVPHRGDYKLFWEGELQTLCSTCHNSAKQREELAGFSRAASATDGWPIDKAHPFNRRRRDEANGEADSDSEQIAIPKGDASPWDG